MGGMQQLGECPKPLPSQVTQLFAMGFQHWFIEAAQELKPERCDPGNYSSPVLGFSGA